MTSPSSPFANYAMPLDTAMGQVEQGLSVVRGRFADLVDLADRWGALLGTPAMLWIRDRIGDLGVAIDKITAIVERAVDHHVPVLSLVDVSFRWLTDVKLPVSSLSSPIVTPIHADFHEWNSPAASAFRAMSQAQKAAVDDVTAKSEFISRWLFDIVKTNVDYAVELAKIMTSLAGNLTQAVADAVSIVSLPLAIDTVAESTGSLVTAGLDNLLTIGERFIDALGKARDILGQLFDYSKFPNGRWPEAVTG